MDPTGSRRCDDVDAPTTRSTMAQIITLQDSIHGFTEPALQRDGNIHHDVSEGEVCGYQIGGVWCASIIIYCHDARTHRNLNPSDFMPVTVAIYHDEGSSYGIPTARRLGA